MSDHAHGEYADRASVEDFAAGLPEKHLLCRELGHNWRPWTAEYVKAQRCYERALRCTRCRAERWQTLSRSGEILSSRYVYPDGYVSHGMGRIVGEGRDALRLESLTRLMSIRKAS